MLGIIFVLVVGLVLLVPDGGLRDIAPKREYKSGTGWCFWRWTEVDSDYIVRLHLFKTPWFAVCLHWIKRHDEEPWLHDHPVSFLSLILRGKYAELRQRMGETTPRFIVRRWFNFIRACEHDKHRIMFARKNTLTLCLMGPKTREWGFHTDRGWRGWKTYYEKKRGEEKPLDKHTGPVFWKDLNERVDTLSDQFIHKYSSRIFIDEEIRRISEIEGDFYDEAPTEPR